MTTKTSLLFARGEDWQIEVQCLDANGAPTLSDVREADFYVGRGKKQKLHLTLGAGISSTSDPSLFEIDVLAGQQRNIAPGAYQYEFWVTYPDFTRSLQAKGYLTVQGTVGGS